MTNDTSDDEFESISSANHNKMFEKMDKMGYKDGVHDGRESQFQEGFDAGYAEGFQNGFTLGKYKGSLSVDSAASTSIPNDLILQRPSRGQCILCTNPSLKDNSISDIVGQQTEHMKKVQSTLESRYGSQ